MSFTDINEWMVGETDIFLAPQGGSRDEGRRLQSSSAEPDGLVINLEIRNLDVADHLARFCDDPAHSWLCLRSFDNREWCERRNDS